MATVATRKTAAIRFETVADLLHRLGDIPSSRVRLQPTPGTATRKDLEDLLDRKQGLFELVDGVLVEKPMGFEEAEIATVLQSNIYLFLKTHDLGKVVGADAPQGLFPDLVRLPDVSFISWDRYPKGKKKPIPDLVPDLAVEVLSKSNTKKEMARKLGEYFRAGVRLVWYVDPRTRTVRVYTSLDRSTLFKESDTLDGGDVLPGFEISIREWFEEAARDSPR